MRFRMTFLALALSLLPLIARAQVVQVVVDLSQQSMTVFLDEAHLYTWPVSTARRGKVTPVGTYSPQYLSANHRSSLYNNAPMPWSVFFHGNYAIHGTTDVAKLGSPASAGCIRLHPDNAHLLFNLVKARPFEMTLITVMP
ncbi:L,D-transpeptidase [Thalassobius vesicularis]|uniref:L,D-transpeptidase n=2 Tax=Thalassobius vesicularis TaxID=1294297 RepID=A0A4S3MCV0_9RHOB|nr:L,D-transpeptidase [Thalassobius vesicularis]